MSANAVLDRRKSDLKAILLKAQPSFAGVLPRHLTAERLVRIALTAVAYSPRLLQCTAQSILLAVMQAAQLGLEIGGPLGHAYLVPYKQTAQFIPGYRGLIDLARRSGAILVMEAVAVYAGDFFDYERGLVPRLVHRPGDDQKDVQNEPPLDAVYAIARMRDGLSQFDVLRRWQVDRIRTRSRAAHDGPWVTDYDEMAKKTVIRRLSKLLPMSIEMAAAIELDNRAEGAYPNGMDIIDLDVPDIEKPSEDVVAEASTVKERVAAAADAARKSE